MLVAEYELTPHSDSESEEHGASLCFICVEWSSVYLSLLHPDCLTLCPKLHRKRHGHCKVALEEAGLGQEGVHGGRRTF